MIRNKMYLILMIAMISLPTSLISQHRGKHCEHNRERIKSEKVAFITEKLDLTVAEAQSFWPLYNEFTNLSDELFLEERQIARELRHNKQELSQNEMSEKLDRLFEIRIEQAKLEKKYHQKYKEVLPTIKVVALFHVEHDFRRHLLRKYKKRSRGN